MVARGHNVLYRPASMSQFRVSRIMLEIRPAVYNHAGESCCIAWVMVLKAKEWIVEEARRTFSMASLTLSLSMSLLLRKFSTKALLVAPEQRHAMVRFLLPAVPSKERNSLVRNGRAASRMRRAIKLRVALRRGGGVV